MGKRSALIVVTFALWLPLSSNFSARASCAPPELKLGDGFIEAKHTSDGDLPITTGETSVMISGHYFSTTCDDTNDYSGCSDPTEPAPEEETFDAQIVGPLSGDLGPDPDELRADDLPTYDLRSIEGLVDSSFKERVSIPALDPGTYALLVGGAMERFEIFGHGRLPHPKSFATIEGTVTEPDGTPIKGAAMLIQSIGFVAAVPEYGTLTNRRGHFIRRVAPGPYSLGFWDRTREHEVVYKEIEIRRGQTITLDIVLRKKMSSG
ncbi:MAG: Carboxypeptidase regulatory-like domain [Actinomycetota bacterium]|nr:Carboxypeptidase regulatory-like domain [Actinomycetota bacterium]